jgi:hypothetical protein
VGIDDDRALRLSATEAVGIETGVGLATSGCCCRLQISQALTRRGRAALDAYTDALRSLLGGWHRERGASGHG